MGIERFVTGSAVAAVLAQRLVRKLCVHCREPYQPSPGELADWRFPPEQVEAGDLTLYRRVGCKQCNKGYLGRTGVYQLMVMDERLRRLAFEHADHEELERAALRAGMRTLWADGLEKAAAGVTTLEELERMLR
jgi:type II secretory ATPase GspE/PulE/Tfp pilus assembly ATPase PilB-like protein